MSNNLTYLNTAACGLVAPQFTASAIELYNSLEHNASSNAEQWKMNEQEKVRSAIAGLMKVNTENVALIPNFSWGINGVVQALKGDERVLMYKKDYPSLLDPFRVNNFDITWLDDTDGFTLPIDAIEEYITAKKIDILAISHVQWGSGYKADLQALGRLCKANDVIFIVDATQSLGAFPIFPAEVDADVFIASNYKWMNGGFGTGVMYINDAFMAKYPPVIAGYNSYMQYGDNIYRPAVASYEPGHPNMFGFSILKAAVEYKQQLGLDKIEVHNKKLTQLLLDEIRALPVTLIGEDSTDNRASIVFIKDEGDIAQKLKDNGIIVSIRNGNIRISMHYYNTSEDVMRLTGVLKNI